MTGECDAGQRRQRRSAGRRGQRHDLRAGVPCGQALPGKASRARRIAQHEQQIFALHLTALPPDTPVQAATQQWLAFDEDLGLDTAVLAFEIRPSQRHDHLHERAPFADAGRRAR